MKWEKVKLGDCCTKIGSGSTPKGGSTVYIDEGVALIRSQNVYNLSFDYSGLVFINSEAAEKLNGVKIEPNDILLNITGDSVARTCLVPIEVIPARVNQHVSIIRPRKNVLDATFLSYYLASPFMQSFMLGLAVGKGTSRNAMTKDMISNFEIPCPAMAIQKKIASILKSYDDLIENNQKQIKLLEEASHRLYKEWFVDLRFPGHEDVKVVDGVPEGWESCKLRDVAEINGRNIDENYPYDKINYIDIGSVRNGRILEKANYNLEEAPGRAKRIVQDGDVIWGMVRPNLRAYAMVLNPDKNDVFSTGFAVLTSKKVPFSFLYCNVTTEEFVGYLVNCTNGAAYPAVKPIHFEEYNVSIPQNNLLNKFHNITEPYFRKIYYLNKQISSLREARDRLLPKLMSGEIEV